MRVFIASLIVMLGSGELQAVTVYDAAVDLTETSIDNGVNPNGVWSYGYRNTAASTEFTLLPVHGQFPGYQPGFTGLKGWFDPDYQMLPVVMKNTTGTPLVGGSLNEITVPPGGLLLHPGDNRGQAVNDAYAVLRWTAPSPATADLAVTFTGLDYSAAHQVWTTTDVHVIKNGVSLFDAEVAGGLPASTNTQSYSVHNLAVVTGDKIDFIVGPGPLGRYSYDATGVSVHVIVPEPSTLVSVLSLLATGALGIAASLWRKRKAA